MTVKSIPNGKVIILSKAFDNKAKILNIFYFLLFTAFGIKMTDMVLDGNSIAVLPIVFLGVLLAAYLFAAYKFLNKSLYSEEIIIEKDKLTIIKRGLVAKKQTYDNALISNFRHLEIKEPTKHALAGESFDYLGFQTQQAVINNMHGDERLAFDYDGRTVKFGENVYTWDFDELNIVLFDVTEKDFRYYQSYEKSFKLDDENESNL